MSDKSVQGNNVSIKRWGVFIAYVLRHNPSAAGIKLDTHGWANVDELIVGINRTGRKIDFDTLAAIVNGNGKHRYAFNEDRTKIRASHGHSTAVDLQMAKKAPPDILYHGTAEKYLQSIKLGGITKRTRLFVHLSSDTATAIKVGARHGKPVVLTIDAKQMYADGYTFYLSENGVWLTDCVPIHYITEIV